MVGCHLNVRHKGCRFMPKKPNKNTVNWLWDVLLTGAFVLLMEPDFTGMAVHEIGGLVLGVALLVHLVLHWRWVLTITDRLRHGTTTLARLKYGLSALLFGAFLTLVVTGILISTLFNTSDLLGLDFELLYAIQDIHFIAADVALLSVALHLALSWKWIVSTTQRLHRGTPRPPARPSRAIRPSGEAAR